MEKMIGMPEKSYQYEIGKAFRRGQVDALLKIGKDVPEIAKILDIPESTIRRVVLKLREIEIQKA